MQKVRITFCHEVSVRHDLVPVEYPVSPGKAVKIAKHVLETGKVPSYGGIRAVMIDNKMYKLTSKEAKKYFENIITKYS